MPENIRSAIKSYMGEVSIYIYIHIHVSNIQFWTPVAAVAEEMNS